ncbi:LysM domain-containing protein [Azospirillum sp. A1-3]|uniref:LysM peptidoglycan-binding domain-containing protein n=1 Tax=Azospirillum sp. A1-3 TaxID=185874 RepID=UPI0020770789|nr:LysM domain-containing protein [Azospirillum sp. A1-3]MCM8734682.1 LysM domain-containing protein [Azospirillum sp. A1-3]
MRLSIWSAAALSVVAVASSAQAQVAYYGTPVVAGTVVPTAAVTVGTVMATPVVAAPVMAAPVVAAPMAVAPVMAAPVLAAPVAYAAGPEVRGFYQVKRGGRLETVARKVGVSLADLVRLNPSLDPQERLASGTLVALPVP